MPPPAPTSPELRFGVASVDSVRVLKLESFPVQAFAYVTGYLPDRATKIDHYNSELVGNQFVVELVTSRPQESIASTQLDPFEQKIPLEIASRPPGTYTVTVNGVAAVFTLDRRNGT